MRHARHHQVLWRLGPDRVLVRHPWPAAGQDQAADLLGLAAMIWIALDEPASVDEIEQRLAEARDPGDPAPAHADINDTLEQLVATGWVDQRAG